SNSFFGANAGLNNALGNFNAFFGTAAGTANTTGSLNAFFGSSAGLNNTTGAENAFYGGNSGRDNVEGSFNAFYGGASGRRNVNGNFNAFYGYEAGFANVSGSLNVFMGHNTGASNETGSENVFLGREAGLSNIVGNGNVYLGFEAGRDNQEGSGNVFLGYRAGLSEPESNKLYIDNSSIPNPLIYGDFSSNQAAINGSLGVGTQDPQRPIHLQDPRAILRIDRDRPDPGFAVVRFNSGFQQVWKSFYFYTFGTGVNQGKFVIADWGTDVSGPDHKARLSIDNEGDIGIGPRFENLGENASAKLHVDGTVRLENLPFFVTGQPLLIDADGNVGISGAAVTTPSLKAENQALKDKVADLEARLVRLEEKNGVSSRNQASQLAQLYQNQPNPFEQFGHFRANSKE
ncbi:MAG: hypothetical protein AAFU64_16590, partial [Bacteroidota bacterium]